MSTFLVTQSLEVAVDEHGHALRVDDGFAVERLVKISDDLTAVQLTADEEAAYANSGVRFSAGRTLISDRRVARALALLSHRQKLRFDPLDGTPVLFDDAGIVASGGASGKIFPRVDPAVIGLVWLADTGKLLLARGRHRSYFSLVAGYVDAGENLEEAFIREVKEETGRRISTPQYWGSQPWPIGESLMVGFSAVTQDEHPISEPDGELAETRWVRPAELSEIQLAGPGSIARAMLGQVYYEETGRQL
ncbi:NAD(+) diphosphatase [Corynebacterium tapiri]|uniref:NAD(+) diphosphatase n=1 Tax=Corynebacterium tapiri TaxID=1448266 RepID=A0A5C4U4Z5_9CORY|nr:NUDIX domain-containing protein [Corynebacterium tapiri]TNL98395.1 NUDIX domain-containing protein [Corynebacterium tapiri]